jgi:DNA replicative helicase MCM subunit Mcm2 (Cdc46/Mcm family)
MIKNEEILVKCSKYIIYCDKCQKELAVEIKDDKGFTVMSKSHYD